MLPKRLMGLVTIVSESGCYNPRHAFQTVRSAVVGMAAHWPLDRHNFARLLGNLLALLRPKSTAKRAFAWLAFAASIPVVLIGGIAGLTGIVLFVKWVWTSA
jgi:hypothetical protein